MWVVLFYNEIEGFRVTSFYPSYLPLLLPTWSLRGEFFVITGSLCHNKTMNDQESYEFEGRRYTSPTLSSTEQADFIDNLRNVQAQNNAQIAQQTYDLGTQVPSNLGGLGGGEAYLNARYQTPQANEIVSTLKAAAQAQELNDVMNNYKAQLQNRYKQKYREYEKAQRAYYMRRNKQNNSGNGGNNGNNGNSGNNSSWQGDVETVATDKPDVISGSNIIPKLSGHNITDFYDPFSGDRWVYDYTDWVKYKNGDWDNPIEMEHTKSSW